MLAKAKGVTKDLASAKGLFRAAVAAARPLPQAACNLALALRECEQHEESIMWLRKVRWCCSAGCCDGNVVKVATCVHVRGRPTLGTQGYLQLLRTLPTSTSGSWYAWCESLESPVFDAQAADAGHSPAYLWLGQALVEQGRIGEALPWLRQAVDTGIPHTAAALAQALDRAGHRWV